MARAIPVMLASKLIALLYPPGTTRRYDLDFAQHTRTHTHTYIHT